MRVVLLGCVKQKGPGRAKARDLYVSHLWRLRREYAEQSGHLWFVLSAKHGLVHPNTWLDPYELPLDALSREERRLWGESVVLDLEDRLGPLMGMTFEIHAGRTYRDALARPLADRGATIEAPLAELSIGRQPAWYAAEEARRAPGGELHEDLGLVRPPGGRDDVAAALSALDLNPRRVLAPPAIS